MRVAELMSRNVQIVSGETPISEAARMMLDSDTGVLPVGSQERLEGMLTDRDIAVRAVAQGRGPDTPVRDVMSGGEPVTCREDQDIDEVALLMSDEQVRRLPVVDQNGRLVGMISLGDLARSQDSSTAEAALSGVAQDSGRHDQSASA